MILETKGYSFTTESVRVGVERPFAQETRGYEVATTVFPLLLVYVCLC